MYDNADEVLATISRDVEAARQRAEAATRFRAEVDAARATASSPDGTVSVTVDASGMLHGLEVTDGAMHRRGRDLARVVRETVYAAQRAVADLVNAKAAETFGADSTLTHRMRDELSLRFVAPEPESGELRLRGLR